MFKGSVGVRLGGSDVKCPNDTSKISFFFLLFWLLTNVIQVLIIK